MAEKIATRAAYGEFLQEEAGRNKDLVVMDADLAGSTKTAMFKKVCPERFFDMGIAEQNLMAEAAGIALSGKTVCASTFAMFASGRAFEIIRNSIGYTHANVKVCATHAGITVGPDGASHQTFEDIALMRTIPGMTVVNPCDAASTKILMRQVIDHDGPCYVRLGRAAVPVFYDKDAELELGKGHMLRDGSDAAVIATGIMVSAAWDAAEKLASEGINVRVIDMHTLKPVDEDIIVKAAEDTGKIVTAEEHSVIGGLGSAVASVLAEKHPAKMRMVGQHDTFGESGNPDELLVKYGMTADDIVKAVKELL